MQIKDEAVLYWEKVQKLTFVCLFRLRHRCVFARNCFFPPHLLIFRPEGQISHLRLVLRVCSSTRTSNLIGQEIKKKKKSTHHFSEKFNLRNDQKTF